MAASADQILIVLVSALVGYGGKLAQDWLTAWRAQKKEDAALWSLHRQRFHLPLRDAGRQLEARLSELAGIYRGEPSQHTPGSLNGDFRELYLLSRDELPWSGDPRPSILDTDGNQPRRDDQAVQRLRKRMCYELTLATSALYWTARYLAYARLVHLHLSGGGSNLDKADRDGLDRLIADVGAALQGKGAGIFSEQQDAIAEMMVDSDGKVLSHYEFRRKLLELPGWEQFTALFLFFISEDDRLDIEALDEPKKDRARFAAKLGHEVDATIGALARLETRLTEICGLQEAAPRTA
ncbi:MAG: hypothetical protein M3N43_06570 [Actinomycetota bacterium]|nr:hypothetical protein [Actinomycetota bacterium]